MRTKTKRYFAALFAVALMFTTLFAYTGVYGSVKAAEGTVNVTFSGDYDLIGEIKIAGKNPSNFNAGAWSSATGTVLADTSANNTFEVAPMFGVTFSSIKVNGVEYADTATKTGEDDATFQFSVPGNTSYTIEIQKDVVCNIIWGYADTVDEDMRVENGTIELVSVNGEAVDVWIVDDTYGYAPKPGDTMLIKAVPDYGYQIAGLEINGVAMQAAEGQSTFTFKMPAGTYHMRGIFSKAENTVTNSVSAITSASVDASGALSTGTAGLTISEAPDEDVSSVVNAINKVATVDLSLDNRFSKGDGTYWTNSVTEASAPVTVSLNMAAPASGETYEVIRDHNGTLTALGAKYNADTQSLSFESDQFSTYTIVTTAANAVYRLYNPYTGEHFYTVNAVERDFLTVIGWKDEGIGWNAPSSGDAVYRLYNPNSGEHFYTTNAVERDFLGSIGWNKEGVAWYSDTNKTTPLYRLYNPYATGEQEAGAHHYTYDTNERDYLTSIGWKNEDIGWYGL